VTKNQQNTQPETPTTTTDSSHKTPEKQGHRNSFEPFVM
jgi:hypothetical protein